MVATSLAIHTIAKHERYAVSLTLPEERHIATSLAIHTIVKHGRCLVVLMCGRVSNVTIGGVDSNYYLPVL
jgi:hypothetical protein